MIHVRVREKDQIRGRKLREADRWINQPFHAEGERSNPDSDPRTEHRISKDGEAIYSNQNRAVTDPRGV